MNANTTQTALAERNLVKNFGIVKALAGADVMIPTGQSVAVMGSPDSGKSTLLHCLSGIFSMTSGEITVGGTSVMSLDDAGRSRLRPEASGFVSQDDQLIPELPANESIALPLMLVGALCRSAIRGANSWLAKVGLESKRKGRSGEMPGGQAQCVAVTRALASSPSVVFADEPTGALDQATGHEIMQVLTATARVGGATLMVVTHDPNAAAWYDRLVEIHDGRIRADTITEGIRSWARRLDLSPALPW